MKKRYIVLAILAIEIITLPAAAQKFTKADISLPSLVVASKVKSSEPGQSVYFVTSNGPFAITAKNSKGEHHVNFFKQGRINHVTFGQNAQLPGEAEKCTKLNDKRKSVIYDATTGTEKTTIQDIANQEIPEILSRTILLSIQYPEDQTPQFEFISDNRAQNLSRAKTCAASS